MLRFMECRYERFSRKVLKKAGFVPTGEIGDEGPIYIRRKMNIEAYRKNMTAETLMGPNSARILEELLCKQPLCLSDTDIILDLGCGTGLTSLILAKETGAQVYASDLWVSVDDNRKRFMKWGVEDRIIPFCEDANALHYDEKLFSALVSVDAYHYFGARRNFFAEKMLPMLRDKSTVLIGIPGIKDAYTGRSEELLAEWLGDEAGTFQSPTSWKEIIGSSDRIEAVETWEMECFDVAWNEWFATENEYAAGDKQYFDTHIKPYSCIVGICIKIK